MPSSCLKRSGPQAQRDDGAGFMWRQRRQEDTSQVAGERLRSAESTKVTMDGKEFVAESAEKQEFDMALVALRKGEVAEAQAGLGLSMANCQVELMDVKAARRTLEDLVKAYPGSEAAFVAKEHLGKLK